MLLYYILPFCLLYVAPNLRKRVIFRGHKKIEKRNSENLFWILLMFSISFIWLYGLRDMGGADDAAYKLYYERNYGGGIFDFLNTDKEPLFNLLKGIGYTFGLNYKSLFLGYAIIDLCLIIAALKNFYRKKSDLTLYLASFFFIAFSGVFTTMRQGVAMAILFYFYSLDNPSVRKRIFVWMLMICSHYGFLLLLPFELFCSIRNYRLSKTIKIAVPCVCLFIGSFVNLSSIIQKITEVLGLYDYMNDSGNYTNNSHVSIVALILFLIYIYLMATNKRSLIDELDKKESSTIDKISYGNMMYFSIMFLTTKYRWGNRVGYYYLFTIPMLIVYFYKVLPIMKKGKILKYAFITLLYISFIFVIKDMLGENGYIWSLEFRS